jgi:hypothetical protein
MVSGALLATVPLTSVAFAWTQPICNPSTGEVLQPSHFADEAAYNKYLKDHPGSFEMGAGDKCAAPASQQAQVATPAAATTLSLPTSETSSAPAPPPGTVVCVVSVNDIGTSVEQRRVLDLTRWLASHPGSFIMASGKDCGPTFTANLPASQNIQSTSPTTGSVVDTTASSLPSTTATASGPLTASPGELPTLAAASVDVAGVTVVGAVLGVETELASPAPPAPCLATSESPEVMATEEGTPGACGCFGAAALDIPDVAALEVAGEFVFPSIPPDAGDGTTADEIVP